MECCNCESVNNKIKTIFSIAGWRWSLTFDLSSDLVITHHFGLIGSLHPDTLSDIVAGLDVVGKKSYVRPGGVRCHDQNYTLAGNFMNKK